jgi:hypothetical protein
MLFNLTCSRHFPSKKTGKEIFCDKRYGPFFAGSDHNELSAYEPFNGEENCTSVANGSVYGITVDDTGRNMLTNQKNVGFTITEMEVWEVTEIEE